MESFIVHFQAIRHCVDFDLFQSVLTSTRVSWDPGSLLLLGTDIYRKVCRGGGGDDWLVLVWV
jgi:hypothetical protein